MAKFTGRESESAVEHMGGLVAQMRGIGHQVKVERMAADQAEHQRLRLST